MMRIFQVLGIVVGLTIALPTMHGGVEARGTIIFTAACGELNDVSFDGDYAVGEFSGTIEWSEVITIGVSRPEGETGSAHLSIGGVERSMPIPGELRYQNPAIMTLTLRWHTDDGQPASWTVSCGSPDADDDGVPEFDWFEPGGDQCPNEPGDRAHDGCPAQPDDDGDGVANDADSCPGFDDRADADWDRIPDGCDPYDSTVTLTYESRSDGTYLLTRVDDPNETFSIHGVLDEGGDCRTTLDQHGFNWTFFDPVGGLHETWGATQFMRTTLVYNDEIPDEFGPFEFGPFLGSPVIRVDRVSDGRRLVDTARNTPCAPTSTAPETTATTTSTTTAQAPPAEPTVTTTAAPAAPNPRTLPSTGRGAAPLLIVALLTTAGGISLMMVQRRRRGLGAKNRWRDQEASECI